MKRFFVKKRLVGGRPQILAGSEARHARTVLRCKPGDRIRLFDDQGVEWESRILDIGDTISCVPERLLRAERESPLVLTVAQAFLKEKKMDTLVRQYTELGVQYWTPFFAERSIARPSAKRLENRYRRWLKITQESLKQCGRHRPMGIGKVATLMDIAETACGNNLNIVFWEGETTPLSAVAGARTAPARSIQVLIGPEGGLTVAEVECLREAGFVSVSLGPRTLRAETASVAAVSLVQYSFGDMA
jgi:16S rRNA (uracil1498-N3)-methyltransferase